MALTWNVKGELASGHLALSDDRHLIGYSYATESDGMGLSVWNLAMTPPLHFDSKSLQMGQLDEITYNYPISDAILLRVGYLYSLVYSLVYVKSIPMYGMGVLETHTGKVVWKRSDDDIEEPSKACAWP